MCTAFVQLHVCMWRKLKGFLILFVPEASAAESIVLDGKNFIQNFLTTISSTSEYSSSVPRLPAPRLPAPRLPPPTELDTLRTPLMMWSSRSLAASRATVRSGGLASEWLRGLVGLLEPVELSFSCHWKETIEEMLWGATCTAVLRSLLWMAQGVLIQQEAGKAETADEVLKETMKNVCVYYPYLVRVITSYFSCVFTTCMYHTLCTMLLAVFTFLISGLSIEAG